MSTAKKNDTVKVHYTGKLTDGKVFDSSVGKDPLQFTVGGGQMIAGFDTAVDGMAINEKKTVNIPAAEAYGESNPDLIQKVAKSNLPDDMNVKVGDNLVASGPDGRQTRVTVTEVNEQEVTIDANHELAGKELVFEIELVEIA